MLNVTGTSCQLEFIFVSLQLLLGLSKRNARVEIPVVNRSQVLNTHTRLLDSDEHMAWCNGEGREVCPVENQPHTCITHSKRRGTWGCFFNAVNKSQLAVLL